MFIIGQIFENTYPVELADWCDSNNCYVLETEPLEDGTRRFEVKEIEPHIETEEDRKRRISQLNMTRGDFIEGLILAQGKDENDIIARIETLPITDVEKKVYINRVKNALNFYRGYPVIDVLCKFLSIPLENMDKFFETKDYNYLKAVVGA